MTGNRKNQRDIRGGHDERFARDAQAGINYLKQRPETDTKHIGVIGHSEGGQVALMLGADRCHLLFLWQVWC